MVDLVTMVLPLKTSAFNLVFFELCLKDVYRGVPGAVNKPQLQHIRMWEDVSVTTSSLLWHLLSMCVVNPHPLRLLGLTGECSSTSVFRKMFPSQWHCFFWHVSPICCSPSKHHCLLDPPSLGLTDIHLSSVCHIQMPDDVTAASQFTSFFYRIEYYPSYYYP